MAGSWIRRVLWMTVVTALSACGGSDEATVPIEAVATLDGAGGVVNGPDGVKLSVPPGALASSTTFRIARNSVGAPELGGAKAIAPVYAITPHGTAFGESARVTIPFDPQQVAPGTRPVVLKASPGGTWTALVTDVSDTSVSAADASSLSFFTVGTCYTTRDAGITGPDPIFYCPSAHQLKLVLRDSNNAEIPVPRNAAGQLMPVATITSATALNLTVSWTRPAGTQRADTLSVLALNAGLLPAEQPLRNFSVSTNNFSTPLTVTIDPSKVPGASAPGGAIVRLQATASYTTDAFYPGCLCLRPATWTFETEIPVRVIYTAPPPAASAPTITTALVDRSVADGTTVDFSVAATGSPSAFTYAWFFGGTSITSPVAGCTVTSASCTITARLADSGKTMRVVVSNGVAPDATSSAVLTVTSTDVAASITQQPANTTAAVGGSASFTVSVAGTPTPTVQWQTSPDGTTWTNASAGTTLSLTGLTLAQSGLRVRAVVTNTIATSAGPSVRQVTSNEATLTVTAPTSAWSSPDTIVTADIDDAAAGIDSARRSLAVWPQPAGTITRIVASRGAVGGSWGAGVTIDNAVGGSGYEPQVAVAPGGAAIAIWGRYANRGYGIAANRFDGTSWGTAEVLDDAATGNTDGQRLAIDGTGRAVAVWRGSFSPYVIRVRVFAGGAWQPAVTLGRGVDASQPQVAVNAQGKGFVSFIESGALVAAPIDLGTNTVGAPVSVATGRSLFDHRLAVDAGGGAVVAWIEDIPGGGYDLRASRYSGAAWGPAEALAVNVGFRRDLDAAAGGAGEAVVSWVAQQPNGDDVAYSRRYVGSAWEAATQHSSAGAQRVAALQVAMNTSGRIVVSWTQYDVTSTFYQAWVQVYTGGWGAAQPVQPSPPSLLVPNLPPPVRGLALGGDGAAVLLWRQNGTPYTLRGAYLQ